MKIISKYLKLLPVFIMVLGLTACSDDDDNNGPGVQTTTVVDVAVANGFDALAAALVRADLVTTLEGPGPFTVFAPTDDAFQDLLDTDPTWNSVNDIPLDLLTNVLLNHVIIGDNIASSELINLGSGYATTGATGPSNTNLSLYFNVDGGTVELNGGFDTSAGADVTTADVEATNGVVHVINKVLLPPTVVDMAIANDDFSSLVASLLEADGSTADPMYVATLSGTGPFTVFAPNNAAFQALLDSNMMWNSPADIDDALLNAVLAHHVVVGNNVQSGDLTPNGTTSPTTLQGQTIDITLPGTNGNIADVVDGAGNDAGIIAVDVQTSNGVIHVVNAVLLPAS
ncbi:putative surface protein with fasciclin (FAS1) repeats [Winogradskyella wandonensis]|uniref:Putative surface protein with fasciclin (FAS1) repeats n=1 Tax=Winogradskyella wandonensis TaxID=1442586 RepID=A0A4R1KVN6_9FLAO|nr:fasciclin domain-containing protein [Winogradskyella wandonensis]TCK68780.1 putative surface protein with fasciclin (FAS1) repeats [Winogradskyella wandonensis]